MTEIEESLNALSTILKHSIPHTKCTLGRTEGALSFGDLFDRMDGAEREIDLILHDTKRKLH